MLFCVAIFHCLYVFTCFHISAVSHLLIGTHPLPIFLQSLPYSLSLRQQVQFEHLRCHCSQTQANARQLLVAAAPRVQQVELILSGLHVCQLWFPHRRHVPVQRDTERLLLKQRAHALRLPIPERWFEWPHHSALLFAGENAPAVRSLRWQQVGQNHGLLSIERTGPPGELQCRTDEEHVVQGGGHLEWKHAQLVPRVQALCSSPGSPPRLLPQNLGHRQCGDERCLGAAFQYWVVCKWRVWVWGGGCEWGGGVSVGWRVWVSVLVCKGCLTGRMYRYSMAQSSITPIGWSCTITYVWQCIDQQHNLFAQLLIPSNMNTQQWHRLPFIIALFTISLHMQYKLMQQQEIN